MENIERNYIPYIDSEETIDNLVAATLQELNNSEKAKEQSQNVEKPSLFAVFIDLFQCILYYLVIILNFTLIIINFNNCQINELNRLLVILFLFAIVSLLRVITSFNINETYLNLNYFKTCNYSKRVCHCVKIIMSIFQLDFIVW
jgi:hypothetical protein